MAREAQGGAYEARGRYFMRVTIAAGQRRAEALPWVSAEQWRVHGTKTPCPCAACERARVVQGWVMRLREAGQTDFVENVVTSAARADEAKMIELARAIDGIVGGKVVKAQPGPPAGSVVTFEAFAMKWVRGELATEYPDHVQRKRSAYEDLGNLRRYVFPIVGPKPIADVTLADYEQVMREADGRATKTKLSRATRRQIAQAMRRVLGLAVYPGKLLKVNPIPEHAMPSKAPEVAQQFVHPDEDAIVMANKAIDLGHRMLIGFLHRQGPRKSEVLGGKVDEVDDAISDEETFGETPPLTWRRIDVRRRVILPDRNKTNDTSLTPIEPDIANALAAWKTLTPRSGDDDPVFVDVAGNAIGPEDAKEIYCSSVKTSLVAAERDRPELWSPPRGWRPLILHNARASFVTVALVNGRSEDWVRRRSKHKSSAIERYRRQLGTYKELDLGDWVPLDVAIPELAAASTATKTAAEAAAFGNRLPDSVVGASGFEPPTPRPPVWCANQAALRPENR